jgi:MFS family permease
MFKSKDKKLHNLVIIAALGYFVDIYDLVLFSIVRVKSLMSLNVNESELLEKGILLINSQMIGMLVGGILWGILGDKKGRVSVLFGSIFLYSAANIANAFVTSVDAYVVIRFIAGVGLAGELGAGITLVSETMSKENRGWGTMIVATVGLLGAVVAALVGDYWSWQTAYLIGGALGIMLLLLRIGVYESGMFESLKEHAVKKGDIKLLFKKRSTFLTYLYCILLGLPVWFVVGIPVTFSPEFGKAFQTLEPLTAGKAILFSYVGLAVGDLLSGVLSQVLKSRKKVLIAFILMSLLSVIYSLYSGIQTANEWYFACVLMGTSVGFWALFVTVASEQFGTNIRATVTTTVPNFVRGAVVPITLGFNFLKDDFGIINSAFIVGIICIGLALFSAIRLKETFGKDLNYTEQ